MKLKFHFWVPILIIALAGCSTSRNKYDPAQYFAFPNAEIVITSGETKFLAEVASNIAHMRFGDKPLPRVSYGRPGFPTVEYHFMGPCATGDVYVFYLEERDSDEITKAIPFIYCGKEAVVFEKDKVKVVIRPKRNEKG